LASICKSQSIFFFNVRHPAYKLTGDIIMQKNRIVFLFCILLITPALAVSEECSFAPWSDYKGDRILSHPTQSAYIFATSHKAVDADGAPNAYHPNDKGLDYLANAGYPNTSWWKSVL
jgi:hypothetical protein